MKRSLSLPVAAIGAIVLGAAGFGAGFVVRAAGDDSSDAPPSNAAVDLPAFGNTPPGFPGGGRDIKLAAEDNDAATSNGAGYAPTSSIMPACMSDLPVTITANGVDLAGAGFVVKPLGSAFVPVSFSIRSVGNCEYDGNGLPKPEEPGKLVVDTTWRHIETQTQVTVSQQLADETVANVIRSGQASFTSGGYTFQVYANVYYYAGVKDGVVPPEVSSRSEPAFAPGYPDPRVEAVVMAAVKDLAPDFSDQCFAREVSGDWADLAKFGLGDPRPAIPSGVALQSMSLVYTNPAPQDCGGADLTPDRNLQFSANWYSDDKAGTNVSIYAGGMGANIGAPMGYTGQVSDNSATWQSNNISFSVYGNRNNGGLGIDTIRAIAKALDPSYDEKCFITQTTFKGDKLGDFGVNKPVLPSGYKVTEEMGTSFDLADGCEKPEGYIADGFSYWAQYENGENYISVNIERSAYAKGDPGTGYAAPGNIYFVSKDGLMVSVSGYSRSGTGGPTFDELKAVAKSIDPSIDLDKLESGNGGGVPVPMPGIRDSSGGSPGR